MTTIQTTTRAATLQDLGALLQKEQADKFDINVDASAITAENGILIIQGAGFGAEIEGFAAEPALFRPTAIMDGQIAEKLGIPGGYLRKLREGKTEKGKLVTPPRIDLYDANVNGWLQGLNDQAGPVVIGGLDPVPADPRNFLVRTFRSTEGGVGIGRALMSDRYGVYDHLDMLMALLAGVKEFEQMTGTKVEVTSCDLSERRMIVRLDAPGLLAHAPDLLKGYRSPFGRGESGTYGTYNVTAREEGLAVGDVVSAGLVATNSETGGGAWTLVPRFTVLQCTNGMTITKDAMRSIHLGSKLDEGVVKWGEDTQRKNVELITAKTRDAVETFLTPAYMEQAIATITEKATKPLVDPAETVEVVAKKMAWTEDEQALIFSHFIQGGQVTTGGILQAVTSAAQEVADGDRAYDLEAGAIEAMEAAYAAA